MFIYIFYAIFLSVFIISPLIGKVILLIVNIFVPDPIPYIDEVVMAVSTLLHLVKVMAVWETVKEHKAIILIGLAVIVGIILCIVIF